MDPFEIIGAFVDGERVDAEAVKAALSTDEGRQYLVDITLLREMTLADGHTPSFTAAATLTKSALEATTVAAATNRRHWMAPLAAAAAVVVALTGGYAAGRHAAPSSNSRGQELARASASQPAPAPTSIIRLEPGVDWHEQTPRN